MQVKVEAIYYGKIWVSDVVMSPHCEDLKIEFLHDKDYFGSLANPNRNCTVPMQWKQITAHPVVSPSPQPCLLRRRRFSFAAGVSKSVSTASSSVTRSSSSSRHQQASPPPLLHHRRRRQLRVLSLLRVPLTAQKSLPSTVAEEHSRTVVLASPLLLDLDLIVSGHHSAAPSPSSRPAVPLTHRRPFSRCQSSDS
ncbi:hypothetical protein PIB30_002630 [Stylosanthes scabra]|uniref:Uncharacterized protein n=1 Tax=Stylosanthes scabra TaxID=79078 RepID=A0ABU6Q2W4_9FABA|nr:hypothetical protein [Stylosanthes scabra]